MVDRRFQISPTTNAASVVVQNLRRTDLGSGFAERSRRNATGEIADVARRISGTASEMVLRSMWNTAYALWEITIFGRGLQSRS